jgi:amidase
MSKRAVAEVEKTKERLAAREAAVQAWEYVDLDGAMAQARSADPSLPLHGFTFGVKDLFDVGGMPTTWGTTIYRKNNVATRDAACVAMARSAGAIIVGKTVTTELAFVNPSKTRNPWNLEHTPGGSSSGSAAAVADGHVRAAYGSQTMGSVLRPAAFCGVVGYKPTYGTISLDGAHAVAPSFDTLGWMTRSVGDAALIRAALLGTPVSASNGFTPKLGFLKTSAWDRAQPAMQAFIEGIAREYDAPEIDFGFDDFDEVFFPIANYEMQQSYSTERLQHLAGLSPKTRALVEDPQYTFARALEMRKRLARFDVEAAFGGMDVLLLPASAGEAPDLTTTGDPVFNRLASLLGLPAITLPAALGPNGLPMGLQLMARRWDDDKLLYIAAAVAEKHPAATLV